MDFPCFLVKRGIRESHRFVDPHGATEWQVEEWWLVGAMYVNLGNLCVAIMMTSCHGNYLRITVYLCGHWWIPCTMGTYMYLSSYPGYFRESHWFSMGLTLTGMKACNADFDVFFDVDQKNLWDKQSSDRWFETPWRSDSDSDSDSKTFIQ